MRFVESPHHSSRGTNKVTGIVIHTAVGTYAGTQSWFKNPESKVSAHYVGKEDGSEFVQMVKEDRAAWHAGVVSSPTTPVYRGGNPNHYTIGIELCDSRDPHGHDRSGQYPAVANLVKEICQRYNLPIDKNHVCGHREIRDSKTCPGNVDVNKIIKLAGGNMGDEFGDMVYKSEQHDKTAKHVYPDKTPRQVSGEDIISHIGGIKSRVTDLDKQLATSKAKLDNKIEELSRKETQLLEEQDLRKRLLGKISGFEETVQIYESRIKVLQGQVDTVSKEKGRLAVSLAECQSANKDKDKKGILKLIIDIIKSILDKLKGGDKK